MVYWIDIIFRTIRGDCFYIVLHVVDRLVWYHSVFNQRSYYRDFFCLKTTLRLRDRHRHVWLHYIDTTTFTAWCISSILIHTTSFYVYTICISELYRSIDSYSPTRDHQVSAMLWNINLNVWCLCEIVQFLLNAVIIVTSRVWGQHRVFVIAIVTCECALSILRNYGLVYVINMNTQDLFFC